MVAKHWSVCRVGLGAQAGMPVLLEGQPPEGNFKILDLKLWVNSKSKEPAGGQRYKNGTAAEKELAPRNSSGTQTARKNAGVRKARLKWNIGVRMVLKAH